MLKDQDPRRHVANHELGWGPSRTHPGTGIWEGTAGLARATGATSTKYH